MSFEARLDGLRKGVLAAKLDAFLVASAASVYYFSAYPARGNEEAFLLLSSDGQATLFTAEVNLSEARDVARGCTVRGARDPERLLASIIGELRSLGLRRVGFDDLRASTYLSLISKGIEGRPKPSLVWNLRKVKDDGELACMRRAAELAGAGMKAAMEALRVGVRERDVAAEAEYAMRVAGSDGVAFETVVASGPRSAFPHGPCSDRVVQEGEFVSIDVGASFGGYLSNLTRTTIVGKPTRWRARLHALVLEAHRGALGSVEAGVPAQRVDRAARSTIEGAGYGRFFPHGVGHGIGIDVHEPPFLRPGSRDVLQVGNVITVEPAVYLPGLGGVRLEDTVLVSPKGAERLTNLPMCAFWAG